MERIDIPANSEIWIQTYFFFLKHLVSLSSTSKILKASSFQNILKRHDPRKKKIQVMK